MTREDLIAFVSEVEEHFAKGKINAPVHFPGGNEQQLIDVFKDVPQDAWVFCGWRSIYHALLHGVPKELVMRSVLAGQSISLNFPNYRFFSSAIVGGILPIACGVASRGHKVYCFIGDMTATLGIFFEAQQYAKGHDLPITFVIEDNGVATNTPTYHTWGDIYQMSRTCIMRYHYDRVYPHVGLEEKVVF